LPPAAFGAIMKLELSGWAEWRVGLALQASNLRET
jgi:hypothetical protein